MVGIFVLRRFLVLLLTVWLASTVIFFLPRLLGQNPFEARLIDDAARGGRVQEGREQIASAYERRFGLGKPLLSQYGQYMWGLVRLDLGSSMSYFPVTVNEIIRGSIYWSIGLLGTTTVIAFVLGTLMGALMGWSPLAGPARLVFLPLLSLSAVPYYLLALGLIYFLAFQWRVFPLHGGYSAGTLPGWRFGFAWEVVYHSILPALSIILAAAGFWAIHMRGMLVTLQGEDFMTQGEAKGLKRTTLFLRYAVRNAMLPQTTGLAVSLGTMVTGAVLVEAVFRYPGLGDMLRRAIHREDLFVVSGIVFVLVLALSLATFLLDVSYPFLDPRTRKQE